MKTSGGQGIENVAAGEGAAMPPPKPRGRPSKKTPAPTAQSKAHKRTHSAADGCDGKHMPGDMADESVLTGTGLAWRNWPPNNRT